MAEVMLGAAGPETEDNIDGFCPFRSFSQYLGMSENGVYPNEIAI